MTDQDNLTQSPAWKKPSDVMRVRLKKRRSSSLGNPQLVAAKIGTCERVSSSEEDTNHRPGKRRNPFGQDGTPPVRWRGSQNDAEEEKEDRRSGGEECPIAGQEEDAVGAARAESGGGRSISLLEALDSGDEAVFLEGSEGGKAPVTEYQQALSVNISGKREKQKDQTETGEDPNTETLSCECLPLDWSIKSRVRFTSSHPFSWSTPLKTTEEANGISSFVRCDNLTGEQRKSSESDSARHSHWKARLQQSLMMWSHPQLPWVKLFPRIMLRSQSTSTSFAAFDEAIQKELIASWSESFRSVFYLLRSGHCPYFYLLAHQYTVLFRAAGVGGVSHIHALFNPTTKGLREAFKEEGIEFSMPLAKIEDPQSKSRSDLEDAFREQYKEPSETESGNLNPIETEVDQVLADDEDRDLEEEELGLSPNDDAASSWLQSMGLDRQHFPTLEPSKVNFQRDHLMRIDNRPESLVLVQGSDIQALYNFLLNTRTTVAATGSTAGIPPTLMAPVAFLGASLSSFKWRPGVVKQAVGNKLQESYSLEITGPLLPHNVFSICQLLEESQGADFGGTFNSHEPTVPFTLVDAQNNARDAKTERQEHLQGNSRAWESLSNHLRMQVEHGQTGILKEFTFNGLYQWWKQ
ncbi:protein downstream neighbor of Son-like [Acanthaster planci]|uniref:Protein downstream neighbor of Son-like n=1 Tax=Acanthaster planci TaxID=133434 RepID=A0A8B7Y9Q5_ACAPL|nr:protein downstream neighbor of Son-like [Acanthaster planci]XP_022089968.1 protein downstream neighbor of Son-like [Acanthaster planci]XP_022089969.1 protein downstream neighbor of Son-like [Acanthaster planci]XP_022089970.1 protein downstream neighbor of Son-like [Acanthaster planci]XP_022089971.1 protein downstream neighbor of Son-like [Acanthaster planci]XP_022089972.1 protein downstream neighbor of Son-like [Acanthaster planci]XP_022089973.1 protein downstream neighbor of Son-like [Aca